MTRPVPSSPATLQLFLPRSIPSTAIAIVRSSLSGSVRQRSADGEGGAGHPIRQAEVTRYNRAACLCASAHRVHDRSTLQAKGRRRLLTARAGFPIAAPVTWEHVEKGVAPDAFTLDRPTLRSKTR